MMILRTVSDTRPPTTTQQFPVQKCPGTVQTDTREFHKKHSIPFWSEGGYYTTKRWDFKEPKNCLNFKHEINGTN